MNAGRVPARALREREAARPPDHELRRHERDRERDARARRAARDGARARGGRGDGRRSPARSCSTSARSRRTGSRRCSPPAGRPTSAASRSCSTRSAPARRATAPRRRRRILDEVDVAVLRGNAGEVATLVGVEAEVRGVESIGAGGDAGRARARSGALARRRRVGHRRRSTTSPTASASLAIANGDPLLASITGTGLHVERRHRLLPRGRRRRRSTRRSRRSSPSASPARTRRATRRGRARSTSTLYDALAALDPGDARRAGAGHVRVHAIVEDLETARRAVEAGATVVQLRVKAPTARGRRARAADSAGSATTFVVNDDVEAALELGADGVHLGQARRGRGARAARGPAARPLGDAPTRRRSPPTPTTSASARSGRRRRRTTPTPPLGLDELARICARRRASRSSRSAASTPRTRPTASAPAPPASPSSARRPIPRSGRRSMRLSELGELGLLAELERRGLIVGRRARRGRSSAAASS